MWGQSRAGVRSQGGRGGKGREGKGWKGWKGWKGRPAGAAPRPAAAAALRYPREFCPDGFAPIPLCHANISASPGELPGVKATRIKAGITSAVLFVFLYLVWFGFPTLGDTATANKFV